MGFCTIVVATEVAGVRLAEAPWGACGGSDDSSCCWLPEAVRFSNSARSDVKFLTSEVVRQLFGGNGGDRTKVRPAAVEAAEAGWTGSGAYVKPGPKSSILSR